MALNCKKVFYLGKLKRGFTLIELLIVVAIIALLLAILVPALNRAKSIAKRAVCQTRLKQIASSWHMYLDDNKDVFYQGRNVNHDFGGWQGTGGGALVRPLNKYLGIPLPLDHETGAEVFHCPADRGGIYGSKAFQYYGNSYQTNILIVGPQTIPVPGGPLGSLHQEINKHLPTLKRQSVGNPESMLLVGDNGWINQWDPIRTTREEWHDQCCLYNMAFFDTHVGFLKIRKGLYVTSKYRILPFMELNGLANQVQEEIPCEFCD